MFRKRSCDVLTALLAFTVLSLCSSALAGEESTDEEAVPETEVASEIPDEPDFREACGMIMQKSTRPGGDAMCDCLAEGLEQSGDEAQILTMLKNSRTNRRKAFLALDDNSRSVMIGCTRGKRGQSGERERRG